MGGAIGRRVIGALLAPARWVERARGRKRTALIGAYGMIASVVLVLAWRQGSLRGLPDIGDPFDLEAFVGGDVPEDVDAFEAFGRALDVLDDRALIAMTHDLHDARKADWAVVSPALESWLDRNREAMRIWRDGAGRSSGRPPWMGAVDFRDGINQVDRLISFNFLALMEAARLQGEGDMAGAWEWYRALMRSGYHIQRRGGYFERLRGMSSVHFAREGATRWAADPRVDGAMLRRAIADVQDAESMAVPDSETHKAEYVRLMRTLDEPWRLKQSVRRESPMTIYHGWEGAEEQWYRYLTGYLEARWWILREPERTRRIARIAYANWLEHCDGIGAFRPPMAERFPGMFVTDPPSLEMAYILPTELGDWIETSIVWEVGIRQPSVRDNWREREEARMGTLRVTLAREAYRRDHDGREAPTFRALVGTYLDRLPAGYDDADAEESQGEQ